MATLRELAELVGGTVVGDDRVKIVKLAPIEKAGPGDITFLANPKYAGYLETTGAAAVIVAPGVSAPNSALLVCDNPYLAFAKVLTHLHVHRPEPKGVLPGATVDATAKLGERITIHPGCVVGAGVEIGDGTILYPNCVLYDGVKVGCDCTLHAGSLIRERCVLGDRVVLQPGVVIGSEGFGYAPDGERYYPIPQIGIVVLEDDVEIGSGSCVDRAALGVTIIRRGCKLDNLVHIGHNVDLGEDCVIAGQAGIAGSARIGRHCTFGGQSGVVGHITVGPDTTAAGGAGIMSSHEGGGVLSGVPAIPHKEWLKAAMLFGRLPEMRREIQRLKKELAELQDKD